MLTLQEKQRIFDILAPKFAYLYPDNCFDEEENEDYYDGEDHWMQVCDIIGADGFEFGASKVVFFFSEIPEYVVKVPILGTYDSYEHDYIDYSQAVPMTKELADYCNNNWNDYCGLEAGIYGYIMANFSKLAKFFVSTEYIGTTSNNINLYVSKKVRTYYAYDCEHNFEISKRSQESAKLIFDTYNRIGGLSSSFLCCLCEQYPEEDVWDLVDFIKDCYIDDLHSQNVGFDENDNPVIMDYCGFNS